jgi:hypothetical protein
VSGWRREAEAVIADTLGRRACWVELGDTVPTERPPATVIVLSLVGHAASEAARARAWRELAGAVVTGEAVAVVDHNRPRRPWAAIGALIAAPGVPGLWPQARWRRLARPTARELQRAGLVVEALRFAAGERVQIVFATRS